MYLSNVLSKKQDVITNFKQGFLPIIIPVLLICACIMPANLSNALLTGATSLLLMFIGRVSYKHILLTIGIALVPIVIIVSLAAVSHKSRSNTASDDKHLTSKVVNVGRVGTWVKRTEDFLFAKNLEVPYQVQQAKIAIAGGSIFYGLGPGNSIAKNYLPQAYNDFIFSIIIEEYGLLFAAIVVCIYILFLYRCIKIFRKFPYAFGAFLALALSFTLVIQALANMAVNVNLIPVTGVTLPLVSMGGSSFIFTCASIGIILSVAKHASIAKPIVPQPVMPTTTTNTTS
jgi:cell division protein FtsW